MPKTKASHGRIVTGPRKPAKRAPYTGIAKAMLDSLPTPRTKRKAKALTLPTLTFSCEHGTTEVCSHCEPSPLKRAEIRKWYDSLPIGQKAAACKKRVDVRSVAKELLDPANRIPLSDFPPGHPVFGEPGPEGSYPDEESAEDWKDVADAMRKPRLEDFPTFDQITLRLLESCPGIDTTEPTTGLTYRDLLNLIRGS